MNFNFNIIIFNLLNLTPTNGVNSYNETPEFNANQIELYRKCEKKSAERISNFKAIFKIFHD
jgi:hypothetical protein